MVVSAAKVETGTVEGLNVEADADTQTGYALCTPACDRQRCRFRRKVQRARDSARTRREERHCGTHRGTAPAVRRHRRVLDDASNLHRRGCAVRVGMAAILAAMFERKRVENECAELAARERANRKAADLAARRAAFLAQTATVFDTALEPKPPW